MTDQERQDLYEKEGNEVWRWVLCGDEHAESSDILFEISNEAKAKMQKIGQGKAPRGFAAYRQALLLRAMAVECYFRALMIKQGTLAVKGGKITEYSHGAIFNKASGLGLQLTGAESECLNRLRIVRTFWGPYPIPRKFSEWRPNIAEIKAGIDPIFVIYPDDEKLSKQIIQKTQSALAASTSP